MRVGKTWISRESQGGRYAGSVEDVHFAVSDVEKPARLPFREGRYHPVRRGLASVALS